jgi:hypothetical protein
MPAANEFAIYTTFRDMDVEVQAITVEWAAYGWLLVAEQHLYLRKNGRQADWLLTKATSWQERLLDKEIVAASYG